MADLGLEFVILGLLILTNGFFALSEMAVMTSRKTRLRQMAKTSRGAAVALELSERPERFLSAVQIGITLVGVVTGLISGASLGLMFSELLRKVEFLAQYAVPLGLALGVIVITLIAIVFGELIPKRAALVAPERIAAAVSRPLYWIARIASPVVGLLSWATSFSLRVLGLDKADEAKVSEEEIQMLVAESHEQGVIDDVERTMVTRVLKFGDRTADSLMTPRNRIIWLNVHASVEENLTIMRSSHYSRYPVMRGTDADVAGLLEAKSLLDYVGSAADFGLFENLVKPLYVPESMRAMNLLEQFRDAEVYLAFVVNEYGDLSGIVTMNDILSAVVGQRAQAGTSEKPAVVRRDDGSFLIDGKLSVEDLGELLLGLEFPPPDQRNYNTLAGLVMHSLGRLPREGEALHALGLRIEVIDLDGARIDKLLVSLALEKP